MDQPLSTAIILLLLIGLTNAWLQQHRFERLAAHPHRRVALARQATRPPTSRTLLHLSPIGKVEDPDDWIRCVSNSLQRFYGKSLYEEISLAVPAVTADVHSNERHVVISHGTQEDPIYNYANKAGLQFSGYSEDEFVQLPSRYSAPDGSLRADRSVIVQHVIQHGWAIIPEAIRQNKAGQCFLVQRILFFNVYDDNGNRIGQAATFDLENVKPWNDDAVTT
jgi:hypothetical protein